VVELLPGAISWFSGHACRSSLSLLQSNCLCRGYWYEVLAHQIHSTHACPGDKSGNVYALGNGYKHPNTSKAKDKGEYELLQVQHQMYRCIAKESAIYIVVGTTCQCNDVLACSQDNNHRLEHI
jgi:hypothetical protein